MSIKTEKIIILGHSGSGKTYISEKLIDKGLKPCLKWTTRPMRGNEEQGNPYNFITIDEFKKAIDEDIFITYETFQVTPENSEQQTWYYGITKDEFYSSQLFIMTTGEYNSLQLNDDDRKKCFVVFLDIDRQIRENRLHIREDKNDSIKRRLDADEIDFRGFRDYDLKITDPDFTTDDIYDLMD